MAVKSAISLKVLNQKSAESFTAQVPYAVISITDPGDQKPNIPQSPHLLGLLSVEFHDLTTQIGKGGYSLFNPKIAKNIFEFVIKHLPNIKLLMVHCGSGRSRSAAIAAVLNDYFNGRTEPFVRGKKYIPNPLVLAIMREDIAMRAK